MAALFAGAGFRALEMRAADVARLAAFHAANPEYFMVVYGTPAPANEAQVEFDDLPPPDFPYTRKWMLLFEDDAGELVGAASLIQDLFAPAVWHVGLFITATALHGSGTPRAMYEALERWMQAQGARWLRLGVVDANARGRAFWQGVGYVEVRRRTDYPLGPRRHLLHVMVKPLAQPDWRWYRQAVPRDVAPLTTRALVPADQERLWDWLHVALWDPPPAPLRPRAVLGHPAVAIYAEGWGREGDVGIVGEVDGEAIGACWMRRIAGGAGMGYVDDATPQLGIALMPAFRGCGFGRQLMRAALDAARAHGYRQVSLTVHPQNPAIALYESCGFEKREVRNTYYLMVAQLR